jgi:hypothetical protein
MKDVEATVWGFSFTPRFSGVLAAPAWAGAVSTAFDQRMLARGRAALLRRSMFVVGGAPARSAMRSDRTTPTVSDRAKPLGCGGLLPLLDGLRAHESGSKPPHSIRFAPATARPIVATRNEWPICNLHSPIHKLQLPDYDDALHRC